MLNKSYIMLIRSVFPTHVLVFTVFIWNASRFKPTEDLIRRMAVNNLTLVSNEIFQTGGLIQVQNLKSGTETIY